MAKHTKLVTREDFGRALTDHATLPVDTVLRKQSVAEIKRLEPDASGGDTSRCRQFVISTGAVDRDNDTIDPAGWHLDNYRKNPVVLWAHDYSSLPVGRATDVRLEGGRLIATAEFADHPMANTVLSLIDGGFMRATSVGFRPMKAQPAMDRDGLDFTEQELLEFSIVPVPANPEALIMAGRKGINMDPMVDWARKTLEATTPKARRKSVLATRVAALATAVGNLKALVETEGATPQPQVYEDPTRPAGQATGDDGLVPPAGQAGDGTALCPACGSEYDGEVCDGCGWAAPASTPGDPHPMNQPNQGGAARSAIAPGRAKMARMQAQQKQAVDGWSVIGRTDEQDPARWNRQLSKAFDVAGEPLEACRTELAWVARYLETQIQSISSMDLFVPTARMGSFLSALDESLSGWGIDATRNLTESGRETPPVTESIQLNSTQRRNFLVSGMRFMRRAGDQAKMAVKLEPTWSGLYVCSFVQDDRVAVRSDFFDTVQRRAGELNFLKGEAFTLGGEFLDRGDLDFDALFLDAAKEAPVRRAVEVINDQAEHMPSRGLLLMGPPGTGKTLSGRVMMRQADSTFIWVSARDFYRSGAFGGLAYAYDIASECAPTILFIEDVDNFLWPDTIDLLKTEMDGIRRREGILTVLTTNFPELLPDALIDRPGRFHDLVEMDLPDEAVRTRMLKSWAPEAPPESIAATAAATDGLSGAHLRELVNFARTIESETSVGIGVALPKALEKIKEQRALVASLREAPDYRPRRQIRSLVGTSLQMVAKRGRVLSTANEGKLRAANEHLDAAKVHMDSVLAGLQPPTQADEESAGKLAIVLAPDDDGLAIRFADDADDTVTDTEIRETLQAAVADALRELAPQLAEQTQAALARARGRVD